MLKRFFLNLLLLVNLLLPLLSTAQDGRIKQVQLSQFELQSSVLIDATGEKISSPAYSSDVYWFPVKVPSTVLTGLVANRVYPDPYSGMNNMLIPDASDEFNKTYNLEQFSHLPNIGNPWKKPYWYRTSFKVPASDKKRHFQLIFKGINYRAAVWLNGQPIADSTKMVGMFEEYSFDVSKTIKAGDENYLAVKIYPLDFPGLPDKEQLKAMDDFFLNGGPTGDIGKNVTMLCSVGWDWMPPVRDRNMGIWQPVFLRTSGDVTVSKPHIITELPNLPDTTVAKISLQVALSNQGSLVSKGNLKISISPENFVGGAPVLINKQVSVEAGKDNIIELNADNTVELLVKQPKLWWPNGYGKPNLYRVHIQYESNGVVSDENSFAFGIRTVASKAVDVPNKSLRRDFYVNGRRVHLTGGAWVPDMMLNRDSVGYEREMHLFKNSNINLVRIWGGGITPQDVFWNLADHMGLMVWSDFWVTGDTHGEFKGSTTYPLESNVFVNNVVSTIYRIRNHPSLLVWTGGNEGHIRKELYDIMRNKIITLDGTRPYIPSSSGFAKLPKGWDGAWPDNLASGVYSGGPYTWQDAKANYKLADNAKDWVFKDETGLPSQPTYNGLKKIIPNLVWDKTLPFPLNNTWGYHDACTGNGHYDWYYKEMVKRYGESTSMTDFSDKMQLMNATGYQGIFEAAGHKLNEIGGVMLWKLNAAFPSVVWQVIDWYNEPNAGYYFMQNALETVHVQLNALDYNVIVLNRTYQPVSKLTVTADVFDLNSKLLSHEAKEISLAATDVQELFSISKVLAENHDVNFVVLNLKDAKGKVISHNTYWLASDNNYKDLSELPKTKVLATILKSEKGKKETTWTVKFSNPSKQLAFFVHPQLLVEGNEVLPSYWSANYFSLAPGETMTATIAVSSSQLNRNKPELLVEGWNVDGIKIPINLK